MNRSKQSERERRAADPLTFKLSEPDERERWRNLQPGPGQPLSATYALQFEEIARAWQWDAALLDPYRNALWSVLQRLDALEAELGGLVACLDPAGQAAMAEAERMVANAAGLHVRERWSEVIRGRAKGGRKKPAPEWHGAAIEHARKLLDTGTAPHEISSRCARRVGRSVDVVRPVLQQAGLVPERKSREK